MPIINKKLWDRRDVTRGMFFPLFLITIFTFPYFRNLRKDEKSFCSVWKQKELKNNDDLPLSKVTKYTVQTSPPRSSSLMSNSVNFPNFSSIFLPLVVTVDCIQVYCPLLRSLHQLDTFPKLSNPVTESKKFWVTLRKTDLK